MEVKDALLNKGGVSAVDSISGGKTDPPQIP